MRSGLGLGVFVGNSFTTIDIKSLLCGHVYRYAVCVVILRIVISPLLVVVRDDGGGRTRVSTRARLEDVFFSRHDWLVSHQGMLGGAISAIIIEDVFDTSLAGVRRGFKVDKRLYDLTPDLGESGDR